MIVSGITTISENLKVGTGVTISPDGDVFFTGIATGNGSGLTTLNASNISSGTVPTARLGSGTASSSTFLRGDSTFAAVTSTTINNNANNRLITGSGTANTLEAETNIIFDGTNLDSGATTDNSVKTGTLRVNHYTHSATNPINLIGCSSGDGYNNVQIGGNDTSFSGTAATGIRFYTGGTATTANGTLRGYFDTSGNFGISNGNLVIGTSGKGIDFSNTTGNNINSSSATTHLLDDYEEGTWTPKIKRYDSGAWYDATMTSNGTVHSSIYRKIGGVVHFQLYWNGWQQSNSNYAVLGGLPYAAVGGGFAGVTYSDAFATQPDQAGMISNGGSQVEFYVSGNQWNTFSTSASRTIYVAGTYMTA